MILIIIGHALLCGCIAKKFDFNAVIWGILGALFGLIALGVLLFLIYRKKAQ